jgi:hypothetical protein
MAAMITPTGASVNKFRNAVVRALANYRLEVKRHVDGLRPRPGHSVGSFALLSR